MLFNCRIFRCGKKKDEFVNESSASNQTTTSENKAVQKLKLGETIIQTSNKPLGIQDLKPKSQFSLQGHKVAEPAAVVEKVVSQSVAEDAQDVELTQQRVLDAVKKIADNKNDNGNKQLYATLTSSKISLNNQTIIIELSNAAQKEMLTNLKQDLLDELRIILENRQTQLNITVSEHETETKAYKPHDKFKLLAEKNPALLELKKRFDLDIEY